MQVVRQNLEAAARSLEAGRASLRDPGPTGAEGEFRAASSLVAQALEALDRPILAVLTRSPWLEGDVASVRALADVVDLLARAGGIAARIVGERGDVEGGAFFTRGRFRFDELDRLLGDLHAIEALVGEAQGQLRDLPHPTLGTVQAAVTTARRIVDQAAAELRRTALLGETLPELLGRDRPRHYLLIFQSPSEARGGGGLMGLFGVVTISKGEVRLDNVASYAALGDNDRVAAPGWFRRYYGPFLSDRQWTQANMSLHFPTTARVVLAMYRSTRGRVLDGVIAVDPVALRSVLPAFDESLPAGPGQDPITADDVAVRLMHDSYVDFEDPRDQDAFLITLVKAFFERLRNGAFNARSLAAGLRSAIDAQHLKMYVVDPGPRAVLRDHGVLGDFTAQGPNVQAVFHNNVGTNKVDFFLHEKVQVDVTIQEDGSAHVETKVSFSNAAPPSPPSLLLGPARGFGSDPPGTNRMYANIVLPKGAVPSDDRRLDAMTVEAEVDRIRLWKSLTLGPGEVASISVGYDLPEAVDLGGDTASFEMTLFPQGLATPAEFEFQLTAPHDRLPSMSYNGRFYRAGSLDVPVTIDVSFAN
ncbi:MAG TPA: DUF4012 domain-containing protein [Actinomycetota bacterium]|nr:DUF4012 domain-containing protein [Actinomycetota bacterium]